MSPINGISLELYAELGAATTDCVNDPAKQAQIVGARGISAADWEAAKSGWTARMQDPALMGRVAMAYMPLYKAALDRMRGTTSVSFEDYAAMCGAAKAVGIERMLATYQIDQGTWSQIAGQWNQTMGADPMRYANYGMMVEQEGRRISSGGAPRPVNIQRSAGGSGVVAPAGIAAAQAPQSPAQAAQQMENQMMAQAVQAQVAATVAAAQAQSAAAYGNAAQNMGMLGRGAMNVMGYGAIAQGIGPGMAVLVQWSDGNRYPASVVQVGGGQVCVAFGDGRQMWVPESAVSKQ